MKSLLVMIILLASTSSFAESVECSAECGYYDLEIVGLTQSLPENPIIKTADFKSLNDACRAMVAESKNVSLAEIASLNTLLKSSWATSTVLDQLENDGFKLIAVLRGKVGRFLGPNGIRGDVFGYPTETEACKKF